MKPYPGGRRTRKQDLLCKRKLRQRRRVQPHEIRGVLARAREQVPPRTPRWARYWCQCLTCGRREIQVIDADMHLIVTCADCGADMQHGYEPVTDYDPATTIRGVVNGRVPVAVRLLKPQPCVGCGRPTTRTEACCGMCPRCCLEVPHTRARMIPTTA